MTSSFVHLHNHTEYSMLDGAQKLKPMFAEVERQQMPAVAMSDHGNMFGAYEFHQVSKGFSEVKPIIGIEAYVAPSSRFARRQEFWGPGGQRAMSDDGEGSKDVSGGGRFTHMTMWARNVAGLKNLFYLSTEASYTGQFPAGKPRMDMELISEHAEGIIATTGCPSGAIQTRLRLNQYDEARAVAASYQDIFGKENYFLELMDHGLSIERDVRDGLLRLAKDLQIPLLATNDAHYVFENQADAHDNLLCIGVGKNKDDVKRFRFQGSGYYLKTAQEMRSLFSEIPEACDNTLLIAERIESYDSVFENVDEMPQYPDVPEGETQESWLRKDVLRGLALRYGDPIPENVLERFETEMSVIGPMGFSSYFLVVADICRYARDNGVPVGPGRGSATGSIVAYATRITELCPLEHGLLFERFLNPERINPPDVDLDFDDRQRERMVRYVTEKYGDEYTAMVNTFGKIKAKNAIKDSSRILGYPFSHGERITKALPPDIMGKSIPLDGIFDPNHPRYGEAGDIRQMYENEPDVKKVMDTAKGVEGLTRGTGVHAAAVILSKTKLTDRIPLHMRAKDGVKITGFDYPSCEDMGLVKMDFLGLRNLGVIDQAIQNIRENRGVDLATVDPMDSSNKLVIPLDNRKTYELLARGDTFGVFQLDGGGMRALLKLMEPTRFEDIAAALALYRPGPMAANAHTNYALRQNGKQDPDPIHPELKEILEPILGSTHHLLVYQEQIMAIARSLANYTLGGADMLRRAMGKKKPEVLAAEWDKFNGGMKANGYSDPAIKAVWDVMLPFSGYAFNKSHTAGYGLVSYWTAYLKANYPAEYMAALLTSVGDDKDKAGIYLADARKLGVTILQPDVNESVMDFAAVGDDVRFGLLSVRNVGEAVIESIVAARKASGKFTSFQDFLDKVELPALNKRAIESLIKGGAFDSLNHTRKALCAAHETAIDAVVPLKKAAAYGQDDLFAGMGGGEADENASFGLHVELGDDEWPRKQLLSTEREMLGMYVSAHPLDGTEGILASHRDTTVVDLHASGRTEGMVRLAGLISSVQLKVTKQGNAWAVVELSDRDGSIEVLFFPASYQLVAGALVEDSVVSVKGRINDRDGAISISGQELQVLDVTSAERTGAAPVQLALPYHRINQKSLADLRRILGSHPGQSPVLLSVRGPQKTIVYQLQSQVNAVTIASDVKGVFGIDAWRGIA
ncbi:DNA polymerase III subunit alpha [Streptomyces erythrochromogenes]|uniref:DNA polymerase III subunit alpha n=1 Tax=Streptomyces erythrochromogenes TaxID=285574 RepID=UPI0034421C12